MCLVKNCTFKFLIDWFVSNLFLFTSLIVVLQVVNTRGNFNYGMKGVHTQISYKGIGDVLSSVYKEGGLRGLYRGVGTYVITCVRV